MFRPLSLLLSLSTMTLFSIKTQADVGIDIQKLKLLPAAEYYDCAPRTIPDGTINLIEGNQLQSVGKKAATSYAHGSRFYISTNEYGEFEGLYSKIYGSEINKDIENPGPNDFFLSKEVLQNTLYLESNELKPDSFIEGFHLPIFTFKLCEENKFSKDNSVCLELGYLSEVDVWSDVVWATLLSKLGYEYNVQDNLKRISLDKEKQRWKTAKLYATWYENGNVTTFLENENGEFKVADIIFGMLNVDSGHNYMGTSKIEAEVINKDIHFSTNKDLYIKSLLYEKGCVKF